MLKLLLLGAVVVLGVVLIVAALRPSGFRIERSVVINAPPDKVFAEVDDFLHWREWSPWEHRDPDMVRMMSGAASGVGSVYAWRGNKDVGEGQMEIVEAVPPSKIRIRLDFYEPMEAHNQAEFTFTAVPQGTRVVWSMTGRNAFFARLICLFMNMDKLVGRDFEAGLVSLKALSEAEVTP